MLRACAFRTVRMFVWLWLKLKHNCNCFRPKKGYLISTEYLIDPQVTVQHVLRRRESGDVDEKYKLEWAVDGENSTTLDELFTHVMPPWLLITKDAEDYTEQLHPYVAKGNVIRSSFLNKKFGTGTWKILNPKTFEEEDFPSRGIIIK